MPSEIMVPGSPWQRVRHLFLTGLVILLPLVITIWLLGLLMRTVETVASPILLGLLRLGWPHLVNEPVVATWIVPIVGVLLTLALILCAGALAGNFVGRRLLEAFDRLMMRVPVVKGIYGAARQLLDAFGRGTGSFRRVVAVEYPRPGVWTIGFLTDSGARLDREDGPPLTGMSLVFLPTTPNPTSGWLAVLPDASVVPLGLTVEEGVKLIVSGGLVRPPGPGAGV
jgi:uncharacterized membrane protein